MPETRPDLPLRSAQISGIDLGRSLKHSLTIKTIGAIASKQIRLQSTWRSGFNLQGGQAPASKEVKLQPPRRQGISLQGGKASASKEARHQPPRK